MSFCSSCGKPLTPGMAFCTACGATIGAAPGATAMPSVTPARPAIDASGIIGDSFRLVFRNFGAFLSTQGIFILLGALVTLAITIVYMRPATVEMMESMRALVEAGEAGAADFDFLAFVSTFLPILGWSMLAALVSGLLTMIGAGFGIVAADMLRNGERVSLGAVWAKLGPTFGAYFSTALVVRLAILGVILGGILLFFLIVPIIGALVVAILLYLRWALAGPAAIFEGGRVGDNMRRSSELTKGVRGDLFMVGLVAIGLVVIPSIVIGTVVGAGASFDPDAAFEPAPLWTDVVRWVFATAAQLVSAFFFTSAIVAFYRKLAG